MGDLVVVCAFAGGFVNSVDIDSFAFVSFACCYLVFVASFWGVFCLLFVCVFV